MAEFNTVLPKDRHSIPQRWRGILYRSQLEVRFKIMFEELGGLIADFEPQGFSWLDKNGISKGYLPDFHLILPSWPFDTYCEIKGTLPSVAEITKVEEFVRLDPQLSVYMIVGSPNIDAPGTLYTYQDEVSVPLQQFFSHWPKEKLETAITKANSQQFWNPPAARKKI